jgi:Protein of unknown function (DUF3106)
MSGHVKIAYLLLVTAAYSGAAQPKPVKPAPAPAAKGGGVPHPRRPMGPPLGNPANPAVRLYEASPEQRERALEKLPPAMQEQIRKQLQRFDAMPPEQQRIIIAQNQRFASLPLEQQQAFRLQFQAFNKLPPERRRTIAMALRAFETMPEAERARMLQSDDFRSRFSPEDLKMIGDLSVVLLPPEKK